VAGGAVTGGAAAGSVGGAAVAGELGILAAVGGLLTTTLGIPIATIVGSLGLALGIESSRGRAYQTALSHGASPTEAKVYQDSVSMAKAIVDVFRTGPYPWRPEQLYAPGYGPSGAVNVQVTQHIQSTDPAAAGRESAQAIDRVLTERLAAYVNMNAMGSTAH
jgi:hypothetical protein